MNVFREWERENERECGWEWETVFGTIVFTPNSRRGNGLKTSYPSKECRRSTLHKTLYPGEAISL